MKNAPRREKSDEIIRAGLEELQRRAVKWNTEFKPSYKRTPAYTIAHMAEEFGEMSAEWRAGRMERTFETDEYGLKHPEGFGSEDADVTLFCAVLEGILGLDWADDVLTKLRYAEDKLLAKQMTKANRARKKAKRRG